MTTVEIQRRRDDIEAAAQNLRECIGRSVPTASRRRRAIDCLRHAVYHATKGLESTPSATSRS